MSKIDEALTALGSEEGLLLEALHATNDYSNEQIAKALTASGMSVSARSVGRWRARYGLGR